MRVTTPLVSGAPRAQPADASAGPQASKAAASKAPLAIGAQAAQMAKAGGWPAEQQEVAELALRDLIAEFAGVRPNLSKVLRPGPTLGDVIRGDAHFAAAALQLFVAHHAKGSRHARAIYDELKKHVPPETVAASTPQVIAAMNAYGAPKHVPRHLDGGGSSDPD